MLAVNSTTTTSNIEATFSCKVGRASEELSWSTLKVRWCCVHGDAALRTRLQEGSRCPQTDLTSLHGEADDARGAEAMAKLTKTSGGGCRHLEEGFGCTMTMEPPAPSSSLSFDCKDGFMHRNLGWSDVKRKWCCQHEKVCRTALLPRTVTTTIAQNSSGPKFYD